MDDQTTTIEKSNGIRATDSHVFNVSVRAWLAVMVIGSVCAISVLSAWLAVKQGQAVKIEEPLYSLSIAALGFYFGQKTTTAKPA